MRHLSKVGKVHSQLEGSEWDDEQTLGLPFVSARALMYRNHCFSVYPVPKRFFFGPLGVTMPRL